MSWFSNLLGNVKAEAKKAAPVLILAIPDAEVISVIGAFPGLTEILNLLPAAEKTEAVAELRSAAAKLAEKVL